MVQNTFLALSLLATSALALKQAQTPMGADVVLPPLNVRLPTPTFLHEPL